MSFLRMSTTLLPRTRDSDPSDHLTILKMPSQRNHTRAQAQMQTQAHTCARTPFCWDKSARSVSVNGWSQELFREQAQNAYSQSQSTGNKRTIEISSTHFYHSPCVCFGNLFAVCVLFQLAILIGCPPPPNSGARLQFDTLPTNVIIRLYIVPNRDSVTCMERESG